MHATLALAIALASCGALPNPPPPSHPAAAKASTPRGPAVGTESGSGPAAKTGSDGSADTASAAAGAATSGTTAPGANGTSSAAGTVDAPPAPGAQSGPPAAPAAPVAASSDRPAALPIARVAGREIDVAELLGLWLHQDSLQVLEHVDHLVLGRLVLAEAARLGIKIEPEVTDKAYRDAVEAIEKTIGAKRPGLTLDRYVDEALGLDPVRYREFLRDEALRGLLAERVVRAWVLASERSEVRVIAVKSEEDSVKVRDALAAGEAFEDVARRLSADSSAKDGGRVPSVVRGDSPIARLSFQTEVGQVGGPQYEKGAWLFVKVESRPEPVQGEWKDVASMVEKSLAERPVVDLEVSQWKPVMVDRYGVDISPLMKLVQ
jgi:parvulin-like peptidyl-prolyl isomerase